MLLASASQGFQATDPLQVQTGSLEQSRLPTPHLLSLASASGLLLTMLGQTCPAPLPAPAGTYFSEVVVICANRSGMCWVPPLGTD